MDKIIYQLQNTAETRQKSKKNLTRVDHGELNYDIDGFTQYLVNAKAIGILLFWKDVEDFTTLFGEQERIKTAEKIYSRYLAPGAEFEITALSEHAKQVQATLDKPSDDLFEQMQVEAYNLMLFQLFPEFWEAIKKQGDSSGASASKLTEATMLSEVLKSNDLEIHLFAEYCREHMCEESITFLLEAAQYKLLFDPLDLEQQAARIFTLYLDPQSEGRIAGCSDSSLKSIQSVLEDAKVLTEMQTNKSKKDRNSVRRDSNTTNIGPELFDKVSTEVMSTLNMDVWPRYKEAVLEGKALKLTPGPAPHQKDQAKHELESRRPSKQAVEAALRKPAALTHLRDAAQEQGMVESVDFCVEVQEYSLLFSEADRKPRAESMYKTYVMPGADLPINVPDTITRKIEANYMKAEAALFEEAYQELLKVISDNIFDRYIQRIDRASEAASVQNKARASITGVEDMPKSGGCCVLM